MQKSDLRNSKDIHKWIMKMVLGGKLQTLRCSAIEDEETVTHIPSVTRTWCPSCYISVRHSLFLPEHHRVGEQHARVPRGD